MRKFIYGFQLLHDIGKAVKLPEHDIVGESLLPPVLSLLQYTPQQAKEILWLTKYHLLLSQVGMSISHPILFKNAIEEWEDPAQRRRMTLLLTLVQWSDATGTFGGVYISNAVVNGYLNVAETRDLQELIEKFPQRRVLAWTQTPSLMQQFQLIKAKAVWDYLSASLSAADFKRVEAFIGSPIKFSYDWDSFTTIEDPENVAKLLLYLYGICEAERGKGNTIKSIGFATRMTPLRGTAFKNQLSRIHPQDLLNGNYSKIGIPIQIGKGTLQILTQKLDQGEDLAHRIEQSL